MPDLHRRFREHGVRLFERHGFRPVGFFTSEIGELTDRLTYILAWDSLAAREACWASFRADPEWQGVLRETDADGLLAPRLRSMILNPTDYSPQP